MILTEIGFQSEAGPVVNLVEITCWYCGSDRDTTVIPEEWSGRPEADRLPPTAAKSPNWAAGPTDLTTRGRTATERKEKHERHERGPGGAARNGGRA